MTTESSSGQSIYDAIVIGGGFYGCAIALFLQEKKNLKKILIIEKENELLSRASYVNQARVHNGYHYPRSFSTAFRSRINLPKFVLEWQEAIFFDFFKIYGISRINSKVSPKQFRTFCKSIGAELKEVPSEVRQLFNNRLIAEVYEVLEPAFNASIIREIVLMQLKQKGIELITSSQVTKLNRVPDGLSLTIADHTPSNVKGRSVFNCTYAGLNHIEGLKTTALLRQEITEMPLVELPEDLKKLGVTIMDGPFFSLMPFPSRGLHTLSHVRYTPHRNWEDKAEHNPYKVFDEYEKTSRFHRMKLDVVRYMPILEEMILKDSLFEVKTILKKNDSDDGRPIFFEQNSFDSRIISIMGGKLDNIYDVFSKLEQITF